MAPRANSKNESSPNPSVTLRLPRDTRKALDDFAARAGTSRADAAERLIVAGLDSDGLDVAEVRADVKAARRIVPALKKRIAEAIWLAVEEWEAEKP